LTKLYISHNMYSFLALMIDHVLQ